MLRRLASVIPLLAIAFALIATPTYAQEQPLGERLKSLTHHTEEGVEAAEQKNAARMQAEYAELHALWETIEDDVRAADPGGYAEIEAKMAAVKHAVQAQPVDAASAKTAYADLGAEINEIAEHVGQATAAPVAKASVSELVQKLNVAYEAAEHGNAAEAKEALNDFIRAWPAVEGNVAARSQDAYTAIETEMGRAANALDAQPADMAKAEAAIERLRDTLMPYADAQTYSWIDAAAIILREGLEALLVIVALLAFLKRSGNQDKRAWVWVGGGVGILCSLITAFVLQAIFSTVSAGQNREVIEGVTGLIAAALLFYVSYWLHSKASIGSWQRYINNQTTQALARGSLMGLALLSFLAVFREGAETAVFYLGMAPSISLNDLLIGLAVGVAILIAIAVLMLVAGVRLPMRLFFRVAGLLVYYLGFKFVGTGIHALQVTGVISTTPIGWMPPVPFFGIFPTVETLLPQLALLATAGVVYLYLARRDSQLTQAQPAT